MTDHLKKSGEGHGGWLRKRADNEGKAIAWIEANHGPILGMAADVLGDLGEEFEADKMKQAEMDIRAAMELSHRIDKMIKLGDPVFEALDGPVAFLVAVVSIQIVRGIERRYQRRIERLEKLRARLEAGREMMTEKRKRRLARRIARLESRI